MVLHSLDPTHPERLFMQMLFYAHSGLRYLILVVGLVAVVYFGYAAVTRSGNEKVGRILGASFSGLVDLQVLIGLIMVAMGAFYPALIGHMFMMVGAAVVSHVAMAFARGSDRPERAFALRLMGVVIALLLIAGGILSIGRSIFGSGAPSFG